MNKLSVIVPAYNEAPTIKEILRQILAVDFGVEFEVVVVDDCSTDGTYEIVQAFAAADGKDRVRALRKDYNSGKGHSIQKGLEVASGDVAVVQDADFEYDPREIPGLLEPIRRGEVDVVYGSRFLGVSRPDGMALPNFLANKFLTFLTNILYGCRLTDMETCYKLVRMDVLRSIELNANRFDFEPELTTKLVKKGIKIVEFPISYKGRSASEGKKIGARDFFVALKVLWRNLFIS